RPWIESAVRSALRGETNPGAEPTRPTTSPSGGTLSVEVSPPTTVSLNGNWDFYYDGITEAKRRGVSYAGKEVVPPLPTNDSYEATMPVPAYWDDHLANLQPTSWWFW